MSVVQSKIKYLTNKDILEEIHKSKLSYCAFVDKSHTSYDFIVRDINDITPEKLYSVRLKRLAEMQAADKKQNAPKNSKDFVSKYTIDDIPLENIVIRVMSNTHIPLNEIKTGKAKTDSETHIRTLFPPFRHYIMKNEELHCVLKSHWKGGLENGEFSQDHGRITNTLAHMFIKLVDKYSQRGNWRGYSYLSEMKSQALLQLSAVGLQFDESRSDIPNPFAYLTQVITNSFVRILNTEKRNQNIRDDMLIMYGATPSYTRVVENEIEQKKD
jgi:hypothetical protein